MRICLPVLFLVFALGCSGDDSGGVFVDPECPVEPVFGSDEVDIPAMLIHEGRAEPLYPEAARVERINGDVLLLITISSRGFVCNILTHHVEPEGWGFETEAIRAVEQWRYEPAIRNGVPVAISATISVEFRIHGPQTSVRSAPLSSTPGRAPR